MTTADIVFVFTRETHPVQARQSKRKLQEEGGAPSGFRFKPDFAAMFLHNHAVREREALARSFAHLFGREEGIEYPGANEHAGYG